MKKILLSLIFFGACSPEAAPEQQTAAPGAAPAPKMTKAKAAPGRIATLAGLYEGGSGKLKHQMCVVDGGGSQRFGLVVWGENMHSCAGSGTVARQGDVLKLAMAGDSACTLHATISGKMVKLPQQVPSGCSYYCGAQAKLGGTELTQVGTGKADAMKAMDLVGEPLCAPESG